jgi:hypothetical protein
LIINNLNKDPAPNLLENNNNNNNIFYPINSTNTENINAVSPNTIQKLKEIVNKADLLEIEIISSLSNQKGIKITINSLGMTENSKRKAFDGITYFGYLSEENDKTNDIKDNNNNNNTENINNEIDFVIMPKDNNTESKNIGRFFRIRYDLNTMGYLIKGLECGFGTFKKITEKTKLKDCYLINMGNSYIVCSMGIDELNLSEISIIDADKILIIKVYSEVQSGELHFFNPQQFKKIYIGRDAYCNIIVDDTLLSRFHCTIEYKEGNDEGWYISDGKGTDDISEEKPSTNGTWLCLMEETLIKDGMIFKSNQNQFKCRIIKQKKNKKK